MAYLLKTWENAIAFVNNKWFRKRYKRILYWLGNLLLLIMGRPCSKDATIIKVLCLQTLTDLSSLG